MRRVPSKYEEGGMVFTELIRQPYQNFAMSAGTVEGAGVDTVFLEMGDKDDGTPGSMYLLRPDEAMAMIWCLSGALWGQEMDRMTSHDQSLDHQPADRIP